MEAGCAIYGQLDYIRRISWAYSRSSTIRKLTQNIWRKLTEAQKKGTVAMASLLQAAAFVLFDCRFCT